MLCFSLWGLNRFLDKQFCHDGHRKYMPEQVSVLPRDTSLSLLAKEMLPASLGVPRVRVGRDGLESGGSEVLLARLTVEGL